MSLFIIFIVIMVIGFFSHHVDLESDDYYQREIAYEQEITWQNNANQLANRPTINISETHVIVQLDTAEKFDEVQLLLKRPNDRKADQAFVIRDTRTFTIPVGELQNGKYEVELSYTVNGKRCLQKEDIYLK